MVWKKDSDRLSSFLLEVCCGENSRLSNTFKEKGGEAIRIFLPDHDTSKKVTAKALIQTIEELQSEKFEVKIWVSIPCSPWCSWQRVNAKTVPGFEEKLKELREASLTLVENVKELIEETKCESYFEWPKNND